MPYASNTDLLGEFKGLTAWNSSTLSATQVDAWCTRASNFIDGNIAGKYSTPVVEADSPAAFSMLQEICIWLVKPKIAGLVSQATGDPKTSAGSAGTDTTKLAMDTLKQIREGTVKLPDATLATAADGVESYASENSSALADSGVPTFTREGDEW